MPPIVDGVRRIYPRATRTEGRIEESWQLCQITAYTQMNDDDDRGRGNGERGTGNSPMLGTIATGAWGARAEAFLRLRYRRRSRKAKGRGKNENRINLGAIHHASASRSLGAGLGGDRVSSPPAGYSTIWALTFPSATAALRELRRFLVLLPPLRLVVVDVPRRLLREPVPAHGARGDVELAAPAPRRLLYRCMRLSLIGSPSERADRAVRKYKYNGIRALESQCINLAKMQRVSQTVLDGPAAPCSDDHQSEGVDGRRGRNGEVDGWEGRWWWWNRRRWGARTHQSYG